MRIGKHKIVNRTTSIKNNDNNAYDDAYDDAGDDDNSDTISSDGRQAMVVKVTMDNMRQQQQQKEVQQHQQR